MRYIDASAIDRALDPVFLADALRDAFAGDIVVPVRHHHEIHRPDGEATLLLMPAWTGTSEQEAFVGTKIVSVYPMNGAKNLPAVMGTYLLMDGTTGAPLATLDGARLTTWRTAAASALARYGRRRRGDNAAMLVAMRGFQQLFGARDPALRLARNFGLGAVGRMAPLKRVFMRQAMGL